MKSSYGLILLSACAIGCEAVEGTPRDAAIGAAQPGCLVQPCGAVEAGVPPFDAGFAPPPGNTMTVVDSGRAAPLADAGSGPITPGLGMDAASVLPDAATSDAGATLSDAQTDALVPAGDAASPYPPISDVSAKGPYPTMTVTSTGPGGAYTIFRPSELAPNGVLNPIISWGNGGGTFPDSYPQLTHLASHGFVVVASDNLLVSGSEVKAGIDWIVQQNETSGSPYHKKLDVKRVGGMGYSFGGLATLEVADDPRYLTIVIISGANTSENARTMNMPKLRTPVAYLCTDDDASEGNCAADFAVIKQPSFFGVMKGTEHTDVTTTLGLGVDAAISRSAAAATAWLRWQVMGDTSYKSWFVGTNCRLCEDSAWTVQQKGLQ